MCQKCIRGVSHQTHFHHAVTEAARTCGRGNLSSLSLFPKPEAHAPAHRAPAHPALRPRQAPATSPHLNTQPNPINRTHAHYLKAGIGEYYFAVPQLVNNLRSTLFAYLLAHTVYTS